MPRALILGEFPTLNGGERSLLAVLPTLQQAGWTIDAHAPPSGPFAEQLQALGIAVHPLAPTPRALEDRRADLAALLRFQTYDLLHANSLAMGRMAGPVAAALNVPSLAHLRDIVRLNAATIADLNSNTRLIAVSQAVADFHISQGLHAEKVQVLHNGVDLNAWSPSPLEGEGLGVRGVRQELGLSQDSQLIALIGQIILRKAQDIALRALIKVLHERPQAHVVLLGARHSEKPETIEYERRLHEIVADAGLTDRVHFLGTRTDLPSLLPQLTVLLHTARQEPLGRVLLEAAACGVPVVATDVGGTREIFPREADDGALLIPVDDVAAAAHAVSQLLDDPALRNRLAITGRRRAEAAFSVEHSAAGLLEHYVEVDSRRVC
jgi:glycosyltransferase involved in cell wall biosynthesis